MLYGIKLPCVFLFYRDWSTRAIIIGCAFINENRPPRGHNSLRTGGFCCSTCAQQACFEFSIGIIHNCSPFFYRGSLRFM